MARVLPVTEPGDLVVFREGCTGDAASAEPVVGDQGDHLAIGGTFHLDGIIHPYPYLLILFWHIFT